MVNYLCVFYVVRFQGFDILLRGLVNGFFQNLCGQGTFQRGH